jgi:hypothetical protein
MVKQNTPISSSDSSVVPVIPQPIALYVSDGLIFELYDGGRSRRRFSIRWETVVPAGKNAPETDPHDGRTVLAARQD